MGNIVERNIDSFSVFNEEIYKVLLRPDLSELIARNDKRLVALLDGRASEVLQTLSPRLRKESGIFFTSHDLSSRLARKISPLLSEGKSLGDPNCGAGDLLVACTEYLPIGNNFVNTVGKWADVISGYDLFDEFITATRLRLILSAAIRSKDVLGIKEVAVQENLFPNLKKRNFYTNKNGYNDISCVLINPPFGYMQAPDDCRWSTGKIQTAGWFLEKLLKSSHPGQHILAILPDVLRSGTRYNTWRKLISQMCSNLEVEAAGKFDSGTDVDVFLLHAITKSHDENDVLWPHCDPNISLEYPDTISTYFDVCVGTIVPHRDLKQGDLFPYLHAGSARQGHEINDITETIRTMHKVFEPPFVVLHRTSSPDDNYRCITSIVNDKRKVAVENHLIILKPKKGNLDTCRRLLRVLNSARTIDFLNQRIRCRHLTTTAINEIPWIEE